MDPEIAATLSHSEIVCCWNKKVLDFTSKTVLQAHLEKASEISGTIMLNWYFLMVDILEPYKQNPNLLEEIQ